MKLTVAILKVYFVTVHYNIINQETSFDFFQANVRLFLQELSTKPFLQQGMGFLQCWARTQKLHTGTHDVYSQSGYYIYHLFNTQNLCTYSQTIYQCATQVVVFPIITVE